MNIDEKTTVWVLLEFLGKKVTKRVYMGLIMFVCINSGIESMYNVNVQILIVNFSYNKHIKFNQS